MQEENKENIVEEITTNEENQTVNNDIDLSKFDSADDDSVYKVDISAPIGETVEEVEPEKEEEKKLPTVEEVMGIDKEGEEEPQQEQEQEYEDDYEEDYGNVPENIVKLVEFMDETGGSLQDFVNLNKDFSQMDDRQALEEYYSMTKGHLSREEMNFLMDQEFSINEDEDSEIDIKKKKIAYKEQVAEAKAYLDGLKSDYYNDIQLNSSQLSEEDEKAIDFYNNYNEQEKKYQEALNHEVDHFLNKTENLFNQEFKGFEYKIGNKKYRYNVKDVDSVKKVQSDVNNYIRKFLNEDGLMEDAAGYHRGLYTAMNADSIAQHFYEQGKADAIKESMAKSKNVNMNPRQQHKAVKPTGTQYRVMGNTSSDYKFKIKSRGRK
jgi:hypothetical protein